MPSIQEKLTKGLAGWLSFERYCNHVGVFSEKYLTKPIADILIGTHGSYVLAELNHDLLRNAKGRPRQVDFGVLDQGTDRPALAIETKWIWGGALHHGRLLYDMIRLELLAHHHGAECYTVLAGRKKDLVKWFDHDRFAKVRNGKRKAFLAFRQTAQQVKIHYHTDYHWHPLLSAAVKDIRDRQLAEAFDVSSLGPYPPDARGDDPVVISWRIWPRGRRRVEFVPQKTRYFQYQPKPVKGDTPVEE